MVGSSDMRIILPFGTEYTMSKNMFKFQQKSKSYFSNNANNPIFRSPEIRVLIQKTYSKSTTNGYVNTTNTS